MAKLPISARARAHQRRRANWPEHWTPDSICGVQAIWVTPCPTACRAILNDVARFGAQRCERRVGNGRALSVAGAAGCTVSDDYFETCVPTRHGRAASLQQWRSSEAVTLAM